MVASSCVLCLCLFFLFVIVCLVVVTIVRQEEAKAKELEATKTRVNRRNTWRRVLRKVGEQRAPCWCHGIFRS